MTIPAALHDLGLIDIRDKLSVRESTPKGCRAPRKGAVTSGTLHYNGPPVKAFGNPLGELHQVIAIDTSNHQSRIGADSLQYHIVITSDGSRYLTRDLDYHAWHCRNADGNEHSLAIHLPLGGAQDATPVQWESTCAVFEAILIGYRLGSRSCIKGHREWAATECPGDPLFARLTAWRRGEERQGGFYRVMDDIPAALIRTGPGRSFPVALDGKAKLYSGDTVDADAITQGEAVGGDARWAHLRTGLGFVSLTLLEAR